MHSPCRSSLRAFDQNGFFELAAWSGPGLSRSESNGHQAHASPVLHALPYGVAIEGCIELCPRGLRLVCTKRVPWSSSILTFLWFSLVGFGTLGFVMTLSNSGRARFAREHPAGYRCDGGRAHRGGIWLVDGHSGLSHREYALDARVWGAEGDCRRT